MRYIVTILLTGVLVGFGVTAYFKGWLPFITFNKPQAVSVQNTEISDVPATISPTVVPLASASASPRADDKLTIIAGVKAALIAKHGSDFSGLNYTVSKIEGNYASGTVNGEGGGGMWFATKESGSWVVVSDGNGVILCSDLAPYPNFPKSMIHECWDSSSDKLVTR